MTAHLDASRLFAALDGQLTPADRAHLEVCAACRQAVADKRALQRALREAAPRPPGPQRLRAQAERLLAALPPAAAATAPAWRWWTGLAAAASAGALAVLVGHTLLSRPPAATARARDPAPVPVATKAALPATARGVPAAARPAAPAVASAPGAVVVAPAMPIRSRRLAAADAQLVPDENQHDLPEPPVAAPTPVRSAVERAKELLEQLQQAPNALALLQELTPLLRVAARQLSPEQLEVLARRIASLVLTPPADEAASELACETALLARRYPCAVELCETYLATFPHGLRAREVALWTATAAHLQLGDCPRALPLYDRALTFSGVLQSYNDEAYLGRARCRLQQRDADGARADLDLFLFKSPERRRDREVRELLEALHLAP